MSNLTDLLEKASILLTPTAYDNGSLHSVKPVKAFGSELIDLTQGTAEQPSQWSNITTNSVNFLPGAAGTRYFNVISTQSTLISGKKYSLTLEISNYSGSDTLGLSTAGNVSINARLDANAIHKEVFVSDGGTLRIFGRATNSATITLSVKEVIGADFDFTRGTIATRLNEQGLIEDVTDTNLPRIDYLGGTGSLLLEPQSTNLITYSEDFSHSFWNKSNATVSTSTITDPAGGQNSFKLVPDSGTGGNRSLGRNFTGLSGLHTQTVFAKKGEYNYIMIRTRNSPQTGVMFDLENGTFNVNLTTAAFDSAKIEDYGNGWFRCSMTLDPSQMTVSGQIFTSFSVGITGSETNSFNGDGTSGIYVFGAQLEEQPFPTSYIPTSGSTVTRNADVCNNAGSSDLISSTEGVFYAEISSLSENNSTTATKAVSISFSSTNKVMIMTNAAGKTLCNLRRSDDAFNKLVTVLTASESENFNKIAISYKSGQNKIFVNGSRVTNTEFDNFTFDFVGNSKAFNKLEFANGSGGGLFEGKVKSVAVYKEALTDAQLTALTT